MSIQGLRERIAGATGPDRALGFEICKALVAPAYNGTADQWFGPISHGAHGDPTASVDAALALIERVLAPLGVEVSIMRGGALALISTGTHPCRIDGSASTPALALIAALLAAVEAGQPVPSVGEGKPKALPTELNPQGT